MRAAGWLSGNPHRVYDFAPSRTPLRPRNRGAATFETSKSWEDRLTKSDTRRFALLVSAMIVATAPATAQSPKVGDPPEARDMRLVGMNDLQARSAYQPTIHKQGARYIAYIGHHGGTPEVPKPMNPITGQAEFNGTSIVDVTDPSKPKYLFHIPGQEGNFEAGGAQMTRVCDGNTLPKGDPNAVYLLRPFGGQGHEIWNVADPSHPVLVSKPSSGLKDTHKSFWECDTGIAYLVVRRQRLARPAHDRGV